MWRVCVNVFPILVLVFVFCFIYWYLRELRRPIITDPRNDANMRLEVVDQRIDDPDRDPPPPYSDIVDAVFYRIRTFVQNLAL